MDYRGVLTVATSQILAKKTFIYTLLGRISVKAVFLVYSVDLRECSVKSGVLVKKVRCSGIFGLEIYLV